jgi:hypothetical protein
MAPVKAGASDDVDAAAPGTDVATMSADDIAAFQQWRDDEKAKKSGPARYRVVVSNKIAGDRVLFSSTSQKRARAYVERNCPRGQHFFVLAPDGSMESYEHERHTGGTRGEDVEVWQTFDRDAYQAPDLSPVNTNDPWADAWEGVQ